jgi:putative two-component system response regulator
MIALPQSFAMPNAAGRVLVVEDDPQNARLLTKLLTSQGFVVEIIDNGARALDSVRRLQPDVVLLDWMLPGMPGIEVCRQLKQDPATRLVPIILLTGMDAREHRLAGISAGADDFLTKPFDVEELHARVRSLLRLKRYTDELESAESVITSLALTVEARDQYTDGHCQRLADYAVRLGLTIGANADDVAALRWGGFLHDVGKIGVPDAVLLKPGRLDADERQVIEQHTVIGERLCGNLRSLGPVRPIVRGHHERLDGSGYPDGLRGANVPLLAQIVGVVDAYDAMTTTRPYRAALPVEHACEELYSDAAKGLFDRELVTQFVGCMTLASPPQAALAM